MRKPSAPAILGALALLLSACSSSGGGGGDQQGTPVVSGGNFTMALSGDPGALDPATATAGATNLALSFAYDTLVYQDKDGNIVPGLADKWTQTPTSVTFTLHKGATCSDGSKVTPTVVADSMNYDSDPKNKSPLLGVLIPSGMTAKADDAAGTVTLQTTDPSPFLLQSMIAVFVVCGKGLTDRSYLAHHTSGSGPFVLTQAVPDDHYTFTVRKGYDWGPNGASTATKGIPSTVTLKVITSESTAANLLLSGDLNAAQFGGPDRSRIEAQPDVIKQELPGGVEDIFANQSTGLPGADPQVRKALIQALDLDQLAKIASSNTGQKATGLIGLSPDPCKDDSVTGHLPSTDVNAANAALDADGWKLGSDGIRAKDGKKLSLSLVYLTSEGQGIEAGAEYMAAQWKQIGVDTKLEGQSDTKFGQTLFSTGDWDTTLVGIGLSLPTQLVGYVSGDPPPNGSNFSNIDNADYVSLSTQASKTLGAAGCKLWANAESALFDNTDVVPVFEGTQLLASRNAAIFVPGGLAQPTSIRMYKA
jgi:peptide/nickel transport system substrate-binding protein